MKSIIKLIYCLLSFTLAIFFSNAFAQKNNFPTSPVDPTTTTEITEYNYDANSNLVSQHHSPQAEQTPAMDRKKKEEGIVPPHSFSVAFYKPNYVLPYYYTASPYNSVYQGITPYGESLKSSEFKYQLSFKIPLWIDIMRYRTSLYFAYTQLSYWQLYVPYEFIRETDYEPELYLSMETDLHVGNAKLDFINFGIEHQSNGWGNNLERTWNRVYAEAILSTEH